MNSVVLSQSPDVELPLRAKRNVALCVWKILYDLDGFSVDSESVEDLSQHESIEEKDTAL